MGNLQKHKQRDEFTEIVKALQKQKNKQPVQLVDAKPDVRYRNMMVEALRRSKLRELYKINLQNLINSKISKDEISSILITLNGVKSNDIPTQVLSLQTVSKIKNRTKNVKINFEDIKNKRRSKLIEQNPVMEPMHLEDTVQGRTKTASDFLIHQITKITHPFSKICARYAKLLQYDETMVKQCNNQNEYEKWEQIFSQNIKQFCYFLIGGCIEIYKKWLIAYTGISDKKYQKWIYNLVVNQIWSVDSHILYRATKNILNQSKVPLKFSYEKLASDFFSGFIRPQIFSIDKQLQIEGHYFVAVYQMSQLTRYSKPSEILKQLQEIKNSICLDIDNYHKLSEKNQIYQVNGDNIMGITSYLLSKIALKIGDIYLQLLFLRIVYGQPIYYSMDVSSYMFSTIVGALEYLESPHFRQIFKTMAHQFSLQKEQNSKTVTESKQTLSSGSFLLDKNT